MELQKTHRQNLLWALQEAKEELQTNKDCLNDLQNGEDHRCLIPSFEISLFLSQQKIKLIEQCLINNEIDF
jgi:hypothetical protein